MKVDIKKVASLARLKLAENKEQEIEKQIEGILDYFAQIQQIPTEGIVPLVTPHDMEVVFREDEALKDPEFAEEILKQAPEVKGRLVKVPPVVGGE